MKTNSHIKETKQKDGFIPLKYDLTKPITKLPWYQYEICFVIVVYFQMHCDQHNTMLENIH